MQLLRWQFDTLYAMAEANSAELEPGAGQVASTARHVDPFVDPLDGEYSRTLVRVQATSQCRTISNF